MTDITNQVKDLKEPIVEEVIPEKKPSTPKKNWLYDTLDISRWVHYQTVIRHLPFVFFLAAIGILYIANAHYAEKNIREVNQSEKEINELRWQYMTSKSELEYISKQSEVAKMAAPAGLKELREPPKILTVKKDER